MPAQDDFALLDRWREGDRRAGDDLLKRHFDRLYCFFRNKVDTEVDDLIQRTFLACIESKDRFRKAASFKTYVLTVARHELYHHFKRKHRERSRDVDLGSESVVDLGSSPSSRAAKREEHRLLLGALRKIPVDLQITLELFYWEGLSTAELAEVLAVPVGTAKTRLRRARAVLETAMSDVDGDPAIKKATLDNFERWARSLKDGVSAPDKAGAEPRD